MNLKNTAIYTSILLFVVGFGIALQFAVLDFKHSDLVFSQNSVEYMDRLIGSVNNNNFDSLTNKTSTDYQKDSLFLSGDESGESSITDVLANLNFFKKIQQKFINPIKMVYNVPSFLLTLFNLDLKPFTFLTNLINLVIYIGIITMIIINLK